MEISSWNFVGVLTSEEVSLILKGADPDDFKMRVNYPDDHFKEQGEVHRWMVINAQKGALNPCGVEVAKTNKKDEVDRDLDTGMFGWRLLEDGDFSWKNYPIDTVRFYVHRNEIFRWLLAEGISEENIPDKIRNRHEIKSDEPVVTDCQSGDFGDVGERHFVSKRDQQNRSILSEIVEQGYSPTEMPYSGTGRGGVKALVKKNLLKNKNMFTKKSFDNVWQGLRDEGLICEKEP